MRTSLLPIVYAYPHCHWDMPPARQRYLTTALSAYTSVYYLDCPVEMNRHEIARRPRAERISDSLTVIRDAFGLRSSRLGQRCRILSGAIDAAWLHSLLQREGVNEYIYWLGAPDSSLLPGMKQRHLIYDCIDPCFIAEHQAQYDREEGAIARRANLVFCTAETLLDRCKQFNTNSFLLPNACSPDEYLPERNEAVPRPAALEGRSGPVIGFMGTIDWRLDVDTLYAAALALPQFTFAVVGRISNLEQGLRIGALGALPNVVVTGAVSLEEGRAYTAAFDVGLIPFLPGPMCDAVNPVKMYMYLAAGKPVVSTWLHECARYAPLVYATQTPQDFIQAIYTAVEEARCDTQLTRKRIAFAKNNTWDERARTAASHLHAQFPSPNHTSWDLIKNAAVKRTL